MPFFCYNKKDYCANPEDCDNCDVFVHGRGGKEVPTNADRIRAMSDEELADFLHRTRTNLAMCAMLRVEPMNMDIEWLKQPADMRGEEDGND